MPKRMLIDASHPEETRVVVLDGQRVDEFDFEAASKRPLKGNIYLAKVTRVEPSLQAAFVEYGGNRQGFLAFSEIHPDYYQIPVADRQALLAEQQEDARRRADDEFESVATGTAVASDAELETEDAESTVSESGESEFSEPDEERGEVAEIETAFGFEAEPNGNDSPDTEVPSQSPIEMLAADESEEGIVDQQSVADAAVDEAEHGEGHEASQAHRPAAPQRSQRPSQRWVRRRHYKIQEVVKRKQIMLVQVVKEERGTKGAALTTYLSLAGRYCVLMPNTPRGGGISRKITNMADRNRLKAAAATLELPEGMGLIVRTAGANRTKLEIKRDYEYLLRMWDQIRELTLQSNAPACVYEEGDIVKRAIRDLYNKDVTEIVVEGEEGYKNAKEFMRMLMPSHAKNVKPYRDAIPIFQKHHIEAQLDAMFQPTVTLKSGGYIVINQTEALVSIDVNSGRATREHSIEETAHKTNLEAADEVARQLRLRDLAGLIVIDFIDMEDQRNDRDVEKRLRDAIKNDRARVQIGKISQFGLLEMSRQRLRAGVVASSTIPCPHCGGQGIVRSVESTALRVLRAIEEEGQRGRAAAINVRVANEVALYTLNQKRRELARIESDYAMTISFEPNAGLMAGNFELDRVAARTQPLPVPQPRQAISADTAFAIPADMSELVEEEEEGEAEAAPSAAEPTGGAAAPADGSKKRRRRRRGRGGSRPAPSPISAQSADLNGGAAQPLSEQQNRPEERSQPQSMSAGNGDGGQGTATSTRRRRRRRKPRSGSPAAAPGGEIPTQAAAEPPPARAPKYEEHTPEPSPFGGTVTPNAPSEPVWSFGSGRAEAASAAAQEAAGERQHQREQARESHRPPQIRERSSATPVTPEQEPAEPEQADLPQRRGWWQRTFKNSG